ncbi:hypothetical protein SASPL_137870 [Salvia splendens]|uniref:Chromo domain-containing protein n=1 Tax=Salvia splendens TaxID=180675 RepID=A0A8X8WSH6_SALSN|nr:hypothetical protein SASPL_137870 [Salvia splendens]
MAPRFFGPFRIEARIGATAYRIELPASARIHPVFHVSLLKRAIGEATTEADLPNGLDETDPPCLPEKVLDTRTAQHEGEAVDQVLVKWLGIDDNEATWMDEIREQVRIEVTNEVQERMQLVIQDELAKVREESDQKTASLQDQLKILGNISTN